MATLPDLLTFHLPMGKTHQQFGIENPVVKFATDPFVLAGLLGGGLSAASMGRKMAHNKGVRRQLAAGFMPKEAAENTVLKGRALGEALDPDSYNAMGGMTVENTGKPMRMYHGTQTPFGRVNQQSVDAVPRNLYGPGYYQSSSGEMVGEGYALRKAPRGPSEGAEYAPNVRMSYVDTRNPFDMEKSYGPDDIPALSEYMRPMMLHDYEEKLVNLEHRWANANLKATDIEDIRKMVDKASDEDFITWLINSMELEYYDDHPMRRALNNIRSPRTIRNAPPEALNQADICEGAMVELDDVMERQFKDSDMVLSEDLVKNPVVREQLKHVRREAGKLGEMYAGTPTYDLTPPLQPPFAKMKGRDLFDRIKTGAAGAEEKLSNLLQGARPSVYARGPADESFEMAREALKRSGFDSITHLGGTNSNVSPHLVNVAWDPEQVYLPYVADEFRSQRPEAAGALLSTLLGGTGVARQSRRRR